MRRIIWVLALQAYALALSWMQLLNGVRTDEAKYLLNIPYPHPPAMRFVLSLLDSWAWQDVFWRIVLASLLVHAVWIVWHMTRHLALRLRVAVAACWLLSAAVMFQAGTVMMAPITALQGLIFVWLSLRHRDNTSHAYLIALFWLLSLFTAYQAVLYTPLVMVIFWRMKLPFKTRTLLFLLPIALLALYTLTNPLVPASMLHQAGKDEAQSLIVHVTESLWVWGIGGSFVLSIVGTLGVLARWRWGLVLSFLLVSAYVILGRYDYYAILFTPLFIAGLILIADRVKSLTIVLPFATALATLLLFFVRGPIVPRGSAPDVMQAIEAREKSGVILIAGPFGHDWQYASTFSIRRFQESLLPQAQAVVCTASCDIMKEQTGWNSINSLPVEVWVKE